MKLYLLAFLLIYLSNNLDNVDAYNLNSLNAFSRDLYETIARSEGRNVLLSPLSVNMALGMVLPGSKRNTRTEILQALHLLDSDRMMNSIESEFSSIYINLNISDSSDLIISNKAFISNTVNVYPQYENALTSYFHAEEEQVDFSNAPQAVRSVNTWVSSRTNNQINEILSARDVDSDTVMVLTNVVYFNSDWLNEFEDYDSLHFTSANGRSSLVSGMIEKDEIFGGNVPELGASFVEFQYELNMDLIMVIILPNNGVSLEEVERKLQTMTIPDVRNNGNFQYYSIIMPQFKFERTIDMIPILQEMGVRDLFDVDNADLSGISDRKLYVNKIIQKVVIDVNKKGTEAAAAAVVDVDCGSSYDDPSNPPIPFVVDRPFHFKIMKKIGNNDGVVIFSGNYKGPDFN